MDSSSGCGASDREIIGLMAEADRLEREAERAAHAGQGSEKEFGYASNVQDELRRA